MAKDCVQCHDFKFEASIQEIPGTFSLRCQKCGLVNLMDENDRPLGWLKRFSHQTNQYVFYAFLDKKICILAQDMKNESFKIIDKFPHYLDVNDVPQRTLIELVDYQKDQEKMMALPDIKL